MSTLRTIFARLVGKEALVEVRFYDDWKWDDYQGGTGYVSTLPGYDDSPKNPIGFLYELNKPEKLLVDN